MPSRVVSESATRCGLNAPFERLNVPLRWAAEVIAGATAVRAGPAPPWQYTFIVAFTGIRGVVSLAAALSIPLMANGEPYNRWDPAIAACNWYPLGTRLKVTRPGTDTSIYVQIKDRGSAAQTRSLLFLESRKHFVFLGIQHP